MSDSLSVSDPDNLMRSFVAPIITASLTSIVFTVIVPYFRDKRKKKIERIERHHKDIYEVYGNWIKTPIVVNPDLEKFDIDSMNINAIKQIIPFDNSENRKMISLWSQAISHLEYKDYVDTFNKFKEIEKSQEQFNNSMHEFLDSHRKNLKKIVNPDDSANLNDSLNILLRFILAKSMNHHKNPSSYGSALNDFNVFVMMENEYSDQSIEFSNPFPNRKIDLVNYLENNYPTIIEALLDFQNNVSKIQLNIEEFKNNLTLIEHNKINGLKGRCCFEGKGFISHIKFLSG